jgi:hypothetical protein
MASGIEVLYTIKCCTVQWSVVENSNNICAVQCSAVQCSVMQ